jgi:hypothetical protein
LEYQLTDEISAFWRTLVPPIFLSGLSIFCFLWVIGKNNRHRIMKFIVEDKSNTLVEINGILVPKKETVEYNFLNKLIHCTGLDSAKPGITLFLFFLTFYGIGQVLLHASPHLLTTIIPPAIFAAGVDDATIAKIWLHYPESTLADLYRSIQELTDAPTSSPITFLDKVRIFIQFDLSLGFVFLVSQLLKRKSRQSNRGMLFRLVLLICILMLLLICILLIEIHQNNFDIAQMFNQASSKLSQNNAESTDLYNTPEFQELLDHVKAERRRYSSQLFYGAYKIRSPHIMECWRFITDIYQEFARFFRHH